MTGRVLVTTHPFGEIDRDPIELLEKQGIPFTLNPVKRRLREQELRTAREKTIAIAPAEIDARLARLGEKYAVRSNSQIPGYH